MRSRRWFWPVVVVIVFAGAIGFLAYGPGGDDGTTGEPASDAEAAAAGDDDGDGDGAEDGGTNLFGGDSPEDRRMPDVVCMDLQSAENEIQDHGVFLSDSTDASGDGRLQINDSNWVVVDQFPPAGSKIGEGDAELFVLKKDERHGC